MQCQCNIRLSSSRLCPVYARYHFRKENYVKKHVVNSNRKYTPYRTINISNDFLCNGMEILTISYDQTYTKIGRTIVYTTGPR